MGNLVSEAQTRGEGEASADAKQIPSWEFAVGLVSM